jgi:type IV pilus assembly protein PilC
MARFLYQAKNNQGRVTQGVIEGSTETEVRNKLQQMNLQVVRVGPSGATAVRRAAPKSSSGKSFFGRKVNSKILGEGLRPGLLKDSALKVKSSIETGRRLADSMAQMPNVFDRLYCNMIQAGEEAGILDSILNRLAIYIEKSEKIKRQIKGAMVYPAVIIAVAILVISGILVFIIPKFSEFFASAGKEPPMLTQMVVALSQAVTKKWYMWFWGQFYLSTTFKVLAVISGKPFCFEPQQLES